MDYNATVIERQSVPNLRLNGVGWEAAISGDWKGLRGDYDFIMTSETVYTREKCGELWALFELLDPEVVLVAGKRFYFGLDGGTSVFAEMKPAGWSVKVVGVWDGGAGNIRECLQITREKG